MKIKCNICGEGTAEIKFGTNECEFKGVKFKVPLVYFECDLCHSEFAEKRAVELNKAYVMLQHAEIVGGNKPLTIKTYKNIESDNLMCRQRCSCGNEFIGHKRDFTCPECE